MVVADVIHKRFSALPPTATIGDVRDWFAASSHRRMAVLADDGRYIGMLTAADGAARRRCGTRPAPRARAPRPDDPARRTGPGRP